jgi:hypothetical protein
LKLIKRKNHLKISLLKIWNESIMDFFLWSKDIPRRSNSDRILVVHMDNPWDKLLDSSDRWTASGKRQGFGVWKLMTFPRCKLWMCHDVPIYILWIYIYIEIHNLTLYIYTIYIYIYICIYPISGSTHMVPFSYKSGCKAI